MFYNHIIYHAATCPGPEPEHRWRRLPPSDEEAWSCCTPEPHPWQSSSYAVWPCNVAPAAEVHLDGWPCCQGVPSARPWSSLECSEFWSWYLIPLTVGRVYPTFSGGGRCPLILPVINLAEERTFCVSKLPRTCRESLVFHLHVVDKWMCWTTDIINTISFSDETNWCNVDGVYGKNPGSKAGFFAL